MLLRGQVVPEDIELPTPRQIARRTNRKETGPRMVSATCGHMPMNFLILAIPLG